MNVLVRHPSVGSVWLERAEFVTMPDGREFVQGDVFDRSGAGSPYMPDDFMGMYEPMNFPASCVVKREGSGAEEGEG